VETVPFIVCLPARQPIEHASLSTAWLPGPWGPRGTGTRMGRRARRRTRTGAVTPEARDRQPMALRALARSRYGDIREEKRKDSGMDGSGLRLAVRRGAGSYPGSSIHAGYPYEDVAK